MNQEKLNRLKAQVRTGGKGTPRRKFKAVPKKGGAADDKRVVNEFQRLGLQELDRIVEVNVFFEDDRVIHFNNPKVRGQPNANTFLIQGNGQMKQLTDLMPAILMQVGIKKQQKIMQELQANGAGAGGGAGGLGAFGGLPGFGDAAAAGGGNAAAAGDAGGAAASAADDDDDDDIPELVTADGSADKKADDAKAADGGDSK